MRVVVNADDFGLLPEVNQGILEAHQAGTVTSATLFAQQPATEDAVRRAADHPRLGIGLHFNLTLERPVSAPAEVPSLVDGNGRFHSRGQLLARALSGRLRGGEVERELRAQLERLQSLGVRPTHLDGHQHIQVLPIVAGVVARVARERNLPVRMPWVHWQRQPSRMAARAGLSLLCQAARVAGLRGASAAFVSVFDYGPPARITAETYAQMVKDSAAPSLEIMVHPSRPSERLREIHPGMYETALAEGDALADPRTAAAIAAAGAQLASFQPGG